MVTRLLEGPGFESRPVLSPNDTRENQSNNSWTQEDSRMSLDMFISMKTDGRRYREGSRDFVLKKL